MITISGKKYARTDAEFTASLFNPGGTCSGFYKPRKNGVLLMDMQKEPFAFVVNNKYKEVFFVSARAEGNKIRYFHSTTSADEATLGITGYMQSHELAQSVIEQVKA